jgi:azurin
MSTDFKESRMKRSSTIWLLCAAILVCLPTTALTQSKPAAGTQKKVRTVNLTGSDAMKYDVTTIQAHPGETLRIVLKNVGSMPKIAMAHNVVVLKPGTDGAAFTTAGIAARDTEFIAPSAKASVLAATALAGAGETVEVMFKVPAKPATYPFVCTFPGHYAAGMHGTIVAK